MKFLAATLAALLAGSASAHTIFQQIGVNGVMAARHNYLRLPTYDGPITDVTSNDVTCNGGPNPLVLISPNVASVPSGAQITLQWGHTLDSSFDGLIIDASHKGPVMVYLAKVADATGPIPRSGWFKIYEDGLGADGKTWAVDKLIANKGKVTVTLPSCLPPGDYLLRGELIALHAAGSYPGAQLYMECAQIRITSGGSASPQTYSIPGIYSGSDPGIKYNLYSGSTSYTIPGPRPFTCGGSTGGNTTPVVTPTSTARVSSTSSTRTSASATPTQGGATVPKYGQCGGINYTGPTTCAAGSTCVKNGDYYSQCL